MAEFNGANQNIFGMFWKSETIPQNILFTGCQGGITNQCKHPMKQCGFSEVHGLWMWVVDCGMWMELPLEVEFRFCCNSIGCIRGRYWSKWQGRWKCGEKRTWELFVFLLQGPEQREIRDGKKQNNKEVDGDPLVLLEQHWMQQRDASAAVQLFNFHENQQEVQVAQRNTLKRNPHAQM